nr:HepT-like ribonuclease domain-containing protein [Pseudanabaena sp. FACHB-2040]
MSTQQIQSFCQRWQVQQLALFGSVLREDFRPDSDLDVLVTFSSQAHPTLVTLAAMAEELEALVHRRIDLVDRASVENSPNWIRRQAILETATVLYADPAVKFLASAPSKAMADRTTRDSAALLDIDQFSRTVLQIAQDLARPALDTDVVTRSAILYQVAILGEAVKRLSPEFRAQHPTVAWKQIAGMRDILTHKYDQVQLDIVWDTLQRDIPALLKYIQPLLPTQPQP